jgi:hypothetical protein
MKQAMRNAWIWEDALPLTMAFIFVIALGVTIIYWPT